MAASFLREAGFLGPYVVRCVSSQTTTELGYTHKSIRSARSSGTLRGQVLSYAILGSTRRCLCRLKLLHHRQTVFQVVRTAASTAIKADAAPTTGGSEVSTKVQTEVLEAKSTDNLYRERYIPITRRSIIRFLVEEEDFLNEQEKKHFEDFALTLDSAIVNKYHGILQDLKSLFDPINPDKDTIQSRKYSRRERLDNEFWLLQRVEDIMEKANFYELEKSRVLKLLAEHESKGVRVSVNLDRYDILRFWVLGREQPPPEVGFLERMFNLVRRKPALPTVEYYKRVVVAIRLKKDSKLLLKSFKEIPVDSLEMLLPDGTMRMNKMDKGVLSASIVIATTGLVAKAVTVMAQMNLDWMLLVTVVTGGIGVQAWTSYKNRRNAYLVEVSRTLYFKNLANNRGLLAAMVDRAEDESFKEALLVYTFLLTQRSPAAKVKTSKQQIPAELGGLTDAAVEIKIQNWITQKTGVHIEFESSEAIRLLKKFGILSETNEKLHVLPLEASINCLPITPQSLIARSMEADLPEGYDRDEYLETEHEYKEEEKRTKRYGWF